MFQGPAFHRSGRRPIESLMVCARAMRELCEAWKNTGRVNELTAQAMSFAEMKKLLSVEEFLKLREKLEETRVRDR
jgi:hypothetical protein